MNKENQCAYWNCGKKFIPKNKKHICCSKKCSGSYHVAVRRKEVKYLAVQYMGGRCKGCGYDKCIDALEFHHLNPDEKDFSISKKGYCFSLEKMKKELDKCILLCSNCHREIHSNSIINSIVLKKMTKNKNDNISININNNSTKINWPHVDEIIFNLKKTNYTKYSKLLGVSDNAIRKHLKKCNINPKNLKREYSSVR